MTFLTKGVVQRVIAEMLDRKTFDFHCEPSNNGTISVTTEKLQKIFARRSSSRKAPSFGVMPTSDDGVMLYIGQSLVAWAREQGLPKGDPDTDNVFQRISPNQTGLVAHVTYAELGQWISEQIKESIHLHGSLEDVSAIVLTFPEPPHQVQVAA